MFKHNTSIHHNAIKVMVQSLKRTDINARVLRNVVRARNTVNNAFAGRGDYFIPGIFVESLWSFKLWRESIFSNQL